MGRGFSLTLKMKNEKEAQEILPILQAAALYEDDFDENGQLTQKAVVAINKAIRNGKDNESLSVANFEIENNVISMRCNPCFDECEGGAFVDAIKTIATMRPTFTFDYESLYEDSIADIYYEERASLKNGVFSFKYSGKVGFEESEAYEINGTYENGKMNYKTLEMFSGFCPQCGYPIECYEGETDVECMCGAVFTYDELVESAEADEDF